MREQARSWSEGRRYSDGGERERGHACAERGRALAGLGYWQVVIGPLAGDAFGLVWHADAPQRPQGRLHMRAEVATPDLVAPYRGRDPDPTSPSQGECLLAVLPPPRQQPHVGEPDACQDE